MHDAVDVRSSVIACSVGGRTAGSRRRIVRMERLDAVKCLSLERSGWGSEEGHCRVAQPRIEARKTTLHYDV